MKVDAIDKYIDISGSFGINRVHERERNPCCRIQRKEIYTRVALPVVVPLLTLSLATQMARGVGALTSGLLFFHSHKIKCGICDVASVIIQAVVLVILMPLSLLSPKEAHACATLLKNHLVHFKPSQTPPDLRESDESAPLSETSIVKFRHAASNLISIPFVISAAVFNGVRDFSIGCIVPEEKTISTFLWMRVGNLFWTVMAPFEPFVAPKPRDIIYGSTRRLNIRWKSSCQTGHC